MQSGLTFPPLAPLHNEGGGVHPPGARQMRGHHALMSRPTLVQDARPNLILILGCRCPVRGLVLGQLRPVPDQGECVARRCLKVIHTPGHCPGHVCFYNEQRRPVLSCR
jgi:glyoxylase-like metal-dependent hydrolase (beta-lactamase superfamily II)